MICDENLGVCTPTNFSIKKELEKDFKSSSTLFYIGDPMCSWCYGMEDVLKDVQKYSSLNNIKFQTILGGLRSSGQVLWDDNFKSFLKNEWTKISATTGKSFSFSIFDLKNYDYDTTPACKAVLIAKILSKNNQKIVLEFFSKIQNKFYALSQDSKNLEFYKTICEELKLDFKEFSKLFEDDLIDKNLKDEFTFARSLSSSFPSLIFVNENSKIAISIGYSNFETVKSRLDNLIKGL